MYCTLLATFRLAWQSMHWTPSDTFVVIRSIRPQRGMIPIFASIHRRLSSLIQVIDLMYISPLSICEMLTRIEYIFETFRFSMPTIWGEQWNIHMTISDSPGDDMWDSGSVAAPPLQCSSLPLLLNPKPDIVQSCITDNLLTMCAKAYSNY